LPEETPIYKNLGFFSEKSRKFSKEIISLPIFPHMTNEEVEYVCDCCNSF
jgi:dTDP-4-amino-4,6-dideoxygalactose transaminase